MITELSSIEEYNRLFIDSLTSSPDSFLPLDTLVSDAIANDRISILPEIQSSDLDYNQHVESYNSEFGPLSDNGYSPTSPFSANYAPLVFPYSRIAFIEKFYNDIFPSISNKVFAYMKQSGRVITIGSGPGKCVIVYPSYFTQEELSSLSLISYSQAVLASVEINALITNQQADINYLIKQNAKLEQKIEELLSTQQSLQSARTEDYLTTWR